MQNYKSLLTKDLEIGQLINILANNVPQNLEEHRNIAINIIKRIISEQVRRLPPPQAVGVPGSSSTAPLPAATPEVTPKNIQDAGTNATAIVKNPQTAAVVNDQIKPLEIPGVSDVASVTKFVTDYVSIIGKMKEVKQLLALLKDVTDVKIYPKVNTTPATVASAASPVPTAPATPAQQPAAAAAPPR